MAWQGVKTWVAGPWSFSDVNAYIRDNQFSMRKFQQRSGYFNEGTGSLNAGFGTSDHLHLQLLESPVDEDVHVNVFYSGQFSTSAGGATTVTVNGLDYIGTLVSSLNFTINQNDFSAVLGFTVPAGSNPGFELSMAINVGSCNYYLNCFYIISPLV